MKIERYELVLVKGSLQLRCISPDARNGYFTCDEAPFRTGKAIPGMRKNGQRLAKKNNVPFVDKVGDVA